MYVRFWQPMEFAVLLAWNGPENTHLPHMGKYHCIAGPFTDPLVTNLYLRPNFDRKFSHKLQNSVIYGKMAVNYEEKSFME